MRQARRRVRGLVLIALAAAGLAIPTSANAAADNQGTEFWLAFMGNYTGNAEKTLFITGAQATSGTVEIPGLSFSQNFSVTPGTVTSVSLPGNAELTSSDGVEAKGIHVTAAQEVTVYGLSRIQFTTDAYLGLPVDVVGTDNIVLGYGFGQNSEFGVAATQDNTTLTINPTQPVGGHPAGTPYNVTLNRGDAYQGRTPAPADLSGTIVSSDKPVSVWGGNACANIPSNSFGACDHVTEQLPPTTTWGTSFVTVPLKTRQNGDTFQFVASQDGTDVSVNGGTVATLNRGQVHNMIIDGRATITSTKPILVAQYSNGSQYDGVTSDPFEMLIPPREQFGGFYTVTTPATGFPNNFVNLVVPQAAVGSVAVDGNPVPAGDFQPIGSSGFSGAQVDVAVGAHNLTGGGSPFGAFMYGFASFDSYGYAGGQSFAPIATVASLSLEPATARHQVGTEGCVTATPKTTGGQGVPDVRVDFNVTGSNPKTGFKNADSSGNSVFCYTGAATGEDSITASVGALSANAKKTWVTSLYAETCGFNIDGLVLTGDKAKGDKLDGSDQKDLIKGKGGDDKINGKKAQDCLFGNKDNDTVKGDEGDDLIRAGKGKDLVKGGDGDDDIKLQDGNDTAKGGPGDDKIKAQARGKDKVNCGGGDDSVIVDRADIVAKNCEKVKYSKNH